MGVLGKYLGFPPPPYSGARGGQKQLLRAPESSLLTSAQGGMAAPTPGQVRSPLVDLRDFGPHLRHILKEPETCWIVLFRKDASV